MGGIFLTYYDKEYYICWECNKQINEEDVTNDWRCPYCNDLLRIHIKNGKDNKVIIRKKGEEIDNNDIVDLLNSSYPFHEVLNVSFERGHYKVALKNHGVYKLNEDDFLNTIQGRWHGDVKRLIE